MKRRVTRAIAVLVAVASLAAAGTLSLGHNDARHMSPVAGHWVRASNGQ